MNVLLRFRPWWLSDAKKLALNYPYTFYKPSDQAICNLVVGDRVKLIFKFKSSDPEAPGAERMWVEVAEIHGDRFIGYLDNVPLHITSLKCGDKIRFKAKHIIDTSIDDPEPSLVDRYISRCFVTNRILKEGERIGYLYREEPDRDEDSGWRFMVGDESDEYMDDAKNISLVSLGAVLRCDDSVIDLLDSPVGSTFARSTHGDFERINA